jgi:hypothetical protein
MVPSNPGSNGSKFFVKHNATGKPRGSLERRSASRFSRILALATASIPAHADAGSLALSTSMSRIAPRSSIAKVTTTRPIS